ncbi:unnamed protein product [Ixodes hexagonus]
MWASCVSRLSERYSRRLAASLELPLIPGTLALPGGTLACTRKNASTAGCKTCGHSGTACWSWVSASSRRQSLSVLQRASNRSSSLSGGGSSAVSSGTEPARVGVDDLTGIVFITMPTCAIHIHVVGTGLHCTGGVLQAWCAGHRTS